MPNKPTMISRAHMPIKNFGYVKIHFPSLFSEQNNPSKDNRHENQRYQGKTGINGIGN
jgi:hypothetical protein